jgi:multidrug resistance efflux pump
MLMRTSSLFRLFLLILVPALTGCTVFATPAATPAATSNANIAPVAAAIVADATVRPSELSALRFEIGGTVTEVLVEEGDSVEAGEPLARLDPGDLQLAVDQARATLGEARAAYAQLEAGSTPEQIAAAEARRDQVQAQLDQTRASVTSGDIAAAEAALRQAQAWLARLQRGADPEPIAAARARVDQSQANLTAQRDALAAAKHLAESQLTQAANTLRTLQDEYSRIYWDNRELEDLPIDLPQERIDLEDATLRNVHNAEEALRQAELALEEARQAEISGIRAAEAQLAEARANLADLLADADPDQLAAAEAQVAAARADLERLRGPELAAQVAAAEAAAREAQAGLDQANAPTRAVDLDVALARIATAEVNLRQAEHTLAKAVLRAPFAGVIGEVNLNVGEQVSSQGSAAVVIADTSTWKIETDNLTERDVVRFSVGAPATISFDALPELTLAGIVSAIKPLGTNSYGDITYTVTVTPEQWDERLRWEMSATVTITP